MEIHGIEKMITAAWITAGILFTPILFILFDLFAGIRKAIEREEKITSEGLRRTFSKMAKYYNVLLALLVIDAIQMAGVWYINAYYEHNMFMFPFITLFGAIGVGIIEVKSIFEKSDEKMKRRVSDVAQLAAELAKHKADPEEVAKSVIKYINKEEDANI